MPRKLDRLSFPDVTRKGDRTRLRLVEAAIECITRNGGARLTFEAVGKAAGMNRAQVRYHFPGLDLLVTECLKLVAHHSQEYAVKRLSKAESSRDKLNCYIETAFYSSRDVPAQIPVLLHGYARGLHQRDFQRLYEKVSDAGNERLASLLNDLLQPLSVPSERVTELSFAIRSLLTGMVLDMHLRRKLSRIETFIELAKLAAFSLMSQTVTGNGYTPDKRPKSGLLGGRHADQLFDQAGALPVVSDRREVARAQRLEESIYRWKSVRRFLMVQGIEQIELIYPLHRRALQEATQPDFSRRPFEKPVSVPLGGFQPHHDLPARALADRSRR